MGRLALMGVRFAIGAVVLLVAFGIAGFLVETRPEPARKASVERSLMVGTVVARAVPVARSWEGFATVEARTVSEISAEVSAAVVERSAAARVGERVSAGQLLFVLDESDAVQRLAGAEAVAESLEAQIAQLGVELEAAQESLALSDEGVRLTRSELERVREATRGQASAPVEIERLERELTVTLRGREELRQRVDLIPPRRRALEAQLAQQRAAIALARLDVERTRVVSPIDGVVDAVLVDVGQRVSVGMPMARVVDPTRLEAPLRLPVTAAAELAVGDPAVVGVETMPEHRWAGAIVRIAPAADPESRTVRVFVEIVQAWPEGGGGGEGGSAPLLRPGQFVMGRVARSEVDDRVIVPRGAVRSGRVFVMNGEGRAVARRVDVSHYISERWEEVDPVETEWAVLAPAEGGTGVVPGERVLVTNLEEIRPGMRVRAAGVEAGAGGSAIGDGGGSMGGGT
ncbi:MAG: efflux RND transporter periplasmic adaptor subunit [Phycisphaerales bacterium]